MYKEGYIAIAYGSDDHNKNCSTAKKSLEYTELCKQCPNFPTKLPGWSRFTCPDNITWDL